MASDATAAATAPNGKYFSKLVNARVLVLGGSSGIGKAVAEAAVEHGAIVVISSSNKEKLAAAVADIGKKYPDRKDFVTSHVCDLADKANMESNIEQLVAYAAKAGPTGVDNPEGIDHIAFTAGDPRTPAPLSVLTVEYLEGINLVMHFGSQLVAKHGLPHMKKSRSSSFTVTGGVLSRKPVPGLLSFAAMGMAMEGVKNGLAVDMKPIRVNIVSPGAVPTERWAHFSLDSTARERMKGQTMTGELGTPEDMAEAYLYLMKDKFVTGASIQTNGGAFFT